MTQSFTEEKAFFHMISPLIIAVVSEDFKKKHTFSYNKDDEKKLNVATETDKKVEMLIIDELRKNFPSDRIFSEETYPNEKNLAHGRVWIIDPICGTINFTRGITTFVSNIALAENGEVVAGCVIDHSRGEYIWSVGEGELYVDTTLFKPVKQASRTVIELNLGSLAYWTADMRNKHAQFLTRVIQETDYIFTSFQSTLSFVYVALGRVDGFVNPYTHLWDLPAIIFLVQQAGGIVTELSGKPWRFTSTNAVGARDKALHKKLLVFLGNTRYNTP